LVDSFDHLLLGTTSAIEGGGKTLKRGGLSVSTPGGKRETPLQQLKGEFWS